MSVYVVNLMIDKGADFQQTFDLTASNGQALNLENYSAAAQMRKHGKSKTAFAFTVSFTDRAAGQIKIEMADTTTRDIKAGRYVYDIILTDSNSDKIKVLEGQALVRETVTR